jgi:hypothetical protein
MSESLPAITKLEAARRQIDFSIDHHFSGGDPFAIHTVVAAALGILRALAESRGDVRTHEAFKRIIRPGKEREFWAVMNRASNFLKHADRDPQALLEDVRAEINDGAIFMAASYYADLSGKVSRPMSVFLAWHASFHPELLTDEYRAGLLTRIPQAEIEIERICRMPRALHLKAGLQLLKQFGSEGGIRVPPEEP